MSISKKISKRGGSGYARCYIPSALPGGTRAPRACRRRPEPLKPAIRWVPSPLSVVGLLRVLRSWSDAPNIHQARPLWCCKGA